MSRATPEGKVKEKVKKILRKYDVWYYMPVQNGMGVVGIPDFICCMDGQFLAIETKAPGRKSQVTPNQRRRMQEIMQADGIVYVADNADDVEELIRGYKEQGKTQI